MHSVRKVGVLALVAALMVVLGALRPAVETPKAEANLAFPGGIAALPSAAPAVPALTDQSVPAIIGTGRPGIVSVFCFAQILPISAGPCPDPDGSSPDGLHGAITFELERLYPTGGGLPRLTFDANGDYRLVVSDNSSADMDAATGVVTVRVNAAAATLGETKGVNEIVLIRATDETGDTRTVQMVVVDTILAFGPTGPLSTASQEQPMFVAYHCDVTGRAPLVEGTLPWAIDPDADGSQGLDDMYDGYYTGVYDTFGPGLGYGSNTSGPINPVSGEHDQDLPDVWCGGDTAGLFDDFVDFQTDLGLFSIQPVAYTLQGGSEQLATVLGYFYPPIVDTDCGTSKSVDVFDVDALSSWAEWLAGGFPTPVVGSAGLEGGCDANGWRDGVVTMMLLGNGEVGTATITAQQGGGVSPPRTIYTTFVGEAALSLFLTAPATMGAEGGEFTAAVVDSSFRPVGDETVSCTLDPPNSGLIIVPQTGTTGVVTGDMPGQLVIKVVPTGAAVVAGGTIALTCRLDRKPSVKAIGVVTLAGTKSESVKLLAGCNPLAATWADDTAIDTVAKAVAPPEALDAVWAFDPGSGAWKGYSAAAPEASDLASVNQLDAIFVCMNAPGTISRPVI
jgi:hypothetical protein